MRPRGMRIAGLGFVTALVAGAALTSTTGATAQASPRLQTWTESSYTSVFADSGPSADSATSIRLDTARNDYEAGQVILRSDASYVIKSVNFTPLRSGPHTIAASNLSFNFVGYQHIDANSAFGSQEVFPVTRTAPADFPDRLLNDPTITVAAGTAQSIWIRAYVPASAAAGTYSGKVTVSTDHGTVHTPITVDVRNVVIPPAKDGAFTTVLWQLFTGNISYDEGKGDTVKLYYGYDRYSPQWWQLIDNVAEAMKRYRTNMLAVPVVRLLIDGGSRVDDQGHYTFNWSRFDEVVERFMQHGGVKRLQGFWQSGRHGPNPPWYTEVIGTDPTTGAAIRSFPETTSTTTDNWLSQYIPALHEHLKAKGWDTIFQSEVSDEPGTADDLAQWKALASKIRSYWPDIKIGDAIPHEPIATQLAPLNDIDIPGEDNYNVNPAPYDAERAKGKDVWIYNAIVPVGNYLNRFVDQPEWDQRMTMWFAYSRNLNGYLHWAMNNWQYTMELQSSKGDGYIVRPDLVRNTVEVSPRYESLRDGIEDWEVLNILGKKDPGLARDLAAALAQRADKYSPDISYMQRIRAMALDAAAGKPVAAHDLAAGRPVSTPAGVTGYQVDLGRQAQVDGLRLQWGADHPTGYQVQLSYDGVHWATGYQTTNASGRDTFAGVNGKARYLRVIVTSSGPYALDRLQVAGFPLASPNLASDAPYTLTHPDGTPAPPSGRFPDSGREATDGVLADAWDDGRAFGYELTSGQHVTVNVTIDLGGVQRVGRVRTHAYEEYPAYRPDHTTVSTSTDGVTFTPHGTLDAVNGESQVWYDFGFAPTTARYVRLTFDKTGTQKATGMFIDDIEAYR